MRHNRHIALYAAIFLVMASLAGPGLFYFHFNSMARNMVRSGGLTPEQANAVKHAYAAYTLFAILRPVTGTENAENAILTLGTANEYIERVTKLGKPDSAGEIRKDMFNNLAGITAARWNRQQENPLPPIGLITQMGKNDILGVEATLFEPAPAARITTDNIVPGAARWLDTHREPLSDQVYKHLENLR